MQILDGEVTVEQVEEVTALNANESGSVHTHDVSVACGSEDAVEFVDASTVCETIYTKSTAAYATRKELPSGSYYLSNDVTCTLGGGAIVIPEDATVNLCLNGHSISCYSVATATTAIRPFLIRVESGATLNITDCGTTGSITGGKGKSSVMGGGIYISGGAIVNMYGGSVTKCASTSTTVRACGIYNLGTFNLYGGSIKGNIGYTYGGGVYSGTDSIFNMYGGTVSENSMYTGTYGYGAGVYVYGGTFNMIGGTISGNTSSHSGDYGAGVYVNYYSLSSVYTEGKFKMSGGSISGNQVPNGYGAGVYVGGSTFEMTGGSITNNTGSSGGAVALMAYAGAPADSVTSFTMTGGTISGNIATGNGGAIQAGSRTTVNISGGTVSGNYALGSGNGGGAIYGAGADITLSGDCVIRRNVSSSVGGAVSLLAYTTTGSLEIKDHAAIQENASSKYGGGIYIQGSPLRLSGGSLTGNTAVLYGGAVYLNQSNFFMSGGTITGNTADSAVGGVYLYAPGNAYFSGTCIIKNNTANDAQSNLYIPINTAKFITVGKTENGSDAPLSADSVIGVTVPSSSLKAYATFSNTNSGDYAGCFVSDAVGYAVTNSRINKLYLTNTYSVTWENVSAENWGPDVKVPTEYLYSVGLAELPQPVRPGYSFGGWYTEPELENEADSIAAVATGDLTFWAKWTDIQGPELEVALADGKNSSSWYDSAGLIVTYQDNNDEETGIELYVKIDDGAYAALGTFSSGDVYQVSEEGEHVYTFKAVDASGNATETEPVTAKVDNTAPAFGTVTYSGQTGDADGWIVGQTELRITVPVIETGSGVSRLDCILTSSDGVVQKTSVDVVSTAGGYQAELVIAAEWKGTVQISCTDALGNRSEDKLIGMPGRGVIVENVAPAISVKAGTTVISASQEFTEAPVLTVAVNDGKGVSSGIQSITWQIGNETPVNVTDLATLLAEKEFSIDLAGRSGTVNVKITAADFAGNQSTKEIAVNIILDSCRIDSAAQASWSGNAVKVSWGAVEAAEGYDIYAAVCGTTMKLAKTVTGNATTSVKLTKVKGVKVSTSKEYKVRIKAYRMINGKKQYIETSLMYHLAPKKSTVYTNPRRVTVSKASVTLKAGKTAKIKASVVKANNKKKLLNHTATIRYLSSDPSIATVNKNGKITAKGAGSCKIYVIAENGVRKTVKVTVK